MRHITGLSTCIDQKTHWHHSCTQVRHQAGQEAVHCLADHMPHVAGADHTALLIFHAEPTLMLQPVNVQGSGMNMRGPIRSIWAYPTLVIFCEGLGIATARSLIEADVEVGSLNLPLRQDVRMYYRVCACSAAAPAWCVTEACGCIVH